MRWERKSISIVGWVAVVIILLLLSLSLTHDVSTSQVVNKDPNKVTSAGVDLKAEVADGEVKPATRPAIKYNQAEDDLKMIEVVRKFGRRLRQEEKNPGSIKSTCVSREYGIGWGGHKACSLTIPSRKDHCYLVSYGLSTDTSFDADIVKTHGCRGFGFDPTIESQTQPFANWWVMKMGAPLLTVDSNDQIVVPSSKVNEEGWILVSPASVRVWLGLDRIDYLKMDCEGCEYTIAQDVLREDPTFFHRVDQFILEVHIPRKWMKSRRYLVEYGRLLYLLEEGGMELQSYVGTGCWYDDEDTGTLPELKEIGYPSEHGQINLCQNFFFARPSNAK